MGAFVYILCALTSLFCTILLFKSYFKNRVKLIFWSALCFVGQFISNFVLFFDLIVLTDSDLSLLRLLPAFIGFLVLIYGLIVETV